jgi:hypothetical protein
MDKEFSKKLSIEKVSLDSNRPSLDEYNYHQKVVTEHQIKIKTKRWCCFG